MKYVQQTWTVTQETIKELEVIAEAIGGQNMSATIRYCIRQVFNSLEKKESA